MKIGAFVKKKYVLEDSLGSVRVVISDEKLLANEGTDATTIDAGDYFMPKVVSFSDTYPFGMSMRSFNPTATRYGYQGQEKENDISGVEGGHIVFNSRIEDARIGRFLSRDPLSGKLPWNSPYSFAENSVIAFSELEGEEKLAKVEYKDINTSDPALKVASDVSHNLLAVMQRTMASGWNSIIGIGETIEYNITYLYNKGPSEYANAVAEYWSNDTKAFGKKIDNVEEYLDKTPATEIASDLKDNVVRWETLEALLSIYVARKVSPNVKASAKSNGIPKKITVLPDHYLTNLQARDWYLAREAKIISVVEGKGWSLKKQARVAFEIRNKIRSKARDLMKDRVEAKRLEVEEPNYSWDEIVKKYKDKGFEGDALWVEIKEASTRSRKSVNDKVGTTPPKKK